MNLALNTLFLQERTRSMHLCTYDVLILDGILIFLLFLFFIFFLRKKNFCIRLRSRRQGFVSSAQLAYLEVRTYYKKAGTWVQFPLWINCYFFGFSMYYKEFRRMDNFNIRKDRIPPSTDFMEIMCRWNKEIFIKSVESSFEYVILQLINTGKTYTLRLSQFEDSSLQES